MQDTHEIKKTRTSLEYASRTEHGYASFDDLPTSDALTPQDAAPVRNRFVRDRDVAARFAVSVVQKNIVFQQVEDILAEHLTDEYRALTYERQQAFKHAGEEVAAKISALVAAGKATLKAVLRLIERWLSLIVTKQGYWWVKQEAYIKAKKILLIHQDV